MKKKNENKNSYSIKHGILNIDHQKTTLCAHIKHAIAKI